MLRYSMVPFFWLEFALNAELLPVWIMVSGKAAKRG